MKTPHTCLHLLMTIKSNPVVKKLSSFEIFSIGSYRPKLVFEKYFNKQVEQSSDNRCVLWRSARVPVFESSFKWHTFLFLMLLCSNLAYFSEMQLVCDGPTDRPTDRRTDRRTDGPTDGHTLL